MVDVLGSIFKRRRNIVILEIGVVTEDISACRASGQHIEDVLDPNAQAADARAAAENIRVGRDAIEMAGHSGHRFYFLVAPTIAKNRMLAAVQRLTETEAVKEIEAALAKGPRRGPKPEGDEIVTEKAA